MYFNYTSRSLVRGGQRTLLAIFCVAVGVMAIVALQLVGLMINGAFNSNVRDANGGDIAIRSSNEPFKQSDLAFFDQLKKDGQIENYTPVINSQGYTGQITIRQSVSVRVVDPAVYPIVTPPTFTNPTNGTIASLLKNDQIVATQPFMDQYNKKIGDSFDLRIGTQTSGIRTIHVKVVGVVSTSGVLAQAGSVILLAINDYKAATPKITVPQQKPSTSSPSGSTTSGTGAKPGTGKVPGTGTIPGAGAKPGQIPTKSGQGTSPQTGSTATTGTTTPAVDPNAVFYDSVYVTASDAKIDSVVKQIQQKFPIADTQTAADALQQQQASIDNIRKFLEIAGLLALLIGGVGIVNTMQVLLSRRKTEIAMLKTTGYRRFDLYLLFGLEAGLLGLIGGVVGAGAATGVSYLVRTLVENTFGLNIPFVLDWFTIGGGVVIGLVTALIFGLLPIVQAANIRPLNVIRELPEGRGIGSFFLTTFLLIVLSVLFCILAIVLLNNDVFLGIASVYGTFIFLGFLSLFFGLVILIVSRWPIPERFNIGYTILMVVSLLLSWLLYRILPAFGGLLLVVSVLGVIVVFLPRTWKANMKMALRNLGRQRARTTTTMLALFVGIFTIGLILVLGQDLQDQINNVINTTSNYNLYAITSNDDTATLRSKLKTLPGLTAYQVHDITSIAPVSINGTPIGQLLPTKNAGSTTSVGRGGALYFLSGIEGYDVANNQIPAGSSVSVISGRNLRPDDAGTGNIVVSSVVTKNGPLYLKLNDKIVVTNTQGSATHTLTVVGIYQTTGFGASLEPIWGTKDLVDSLAPANLSEATFYLKIDSAQLSKANDIIGNAVPNAFVLNLSSLTDFINQLLNDILLTLTTIASLSLLAGIIIIANAVALAMLERRRELGILKSVGYTSQSILSEVLLENGLVGGTGALLAMLLVTLVTSILGKFVFKADFGVSTIIALGLILGSALLAMLTASLVAWGSVRVRPLEVLRYE